MNLTVHQKLESIRGDLNSKECKKIMKKINDKKGSLYDHLGLGFAVESIYQDKPRSKNSSSYDRFRKKEIQMYGRRISKKSSKDTVEKQHEKEEKKKYEVNMKNDQTRQLYFENIPNM